MDPKKIMEFLRGNLDFSTLSETEKKDLLSSLREDHSKAQTELVSRDKLIEELTEQVETLSESVATLTDEKTKFEIDLQAYEELEKQRLTERKEKLLIEIEEEMKLVGREVDEVQKEKLESFDVSYLETFLDFLKNTPVNINELNQTKPEGEVNVVEGTETDPNDVYGENHGSEKPVTTLYDAKSFGKGEYK